MADILIDQPQTTIPPPSTSDMEVHAVDTDCYRDFTRAIAPPAEEIDDTCDGWEE